MAKKELKKIKSELESYIKEDSSIKKKTIEIGIPRKFEENQNAKFFILFVSIFVSLIGLIFAFQNISNYEAKAEEAREISRPAEMELIEITASDCEECFDINTAITDLENQNVEFTSKESFDYKSAEAQELITKYNITKLPTYIVTGELDKNENLEVYLSKNTEQQDDGAVFTNLVPAYFDVEQDRIRGRVTATYIVDSSCKQCQDLTQMINYYKQSGVQVIKENTVEWNSEEGKKLIAKYNIERVPTFILNAEAEVYPNIADVWSNAGSVVDNNYIANVINPPYRDLKSNKVEGLVSVILLEDKSCTECYDSQINKNIIVNNFRVGIVNETILDVNSEQGKNFINKYNIQNVPAILISPEAKVYTNLEAAWKNVGTIENDGWFVFREPSKLGQGIIYKNISTGEIVGKPTE